MVELEASSPAHTRVPPPPGLLNTAFLVSSLQDEPAENVWTGEQEQLGRWAESCCGVRVTRQWRLSASTWMPVQPAPSSGMACGRYVFSFTCSQKQPPSSELEISPPQGNELDAARGT
ncbi:hypothetical protein EYF80_051092 [Liparis tanakae]|uniref:Uncharacterized protein n=1 Tax=Liparis tanakae TaxID=230148 RepID=A0A4Z2FBU8_9TELE|nr:hypothetical protein EYF80_051092 [Liparis tanakae]